ncbi:cellulose synthase operon protein YhjQ/BcsQ [Vibrio sp. 10N.261.51.F12]|uniref:cellulose synthase operon protein YhjQ/BcsQ n=1 Tax=Vibrio sp. 10N.261.51.F12 TaxID=3229679 RepID=UPI003551E636
MALISVQSVNSGAGANTVAANMAAAYTSRGKKVVLIELDNRNVLGCWFGKHTLDDDGWANAHSNGKSWKDAIFMSPGGTCFIPFGDAHLDIEIMINVLSKMCQTASLKFDYIIVLLPNNLKIEDYGVSVDLALKVINPTPLSVTMLSKRLNNNPAMENTRFVLNACRHDVGLSRELVLVLEKMLGDKLLSSYLYFDIAVQETFAELSNVIVSALYSQSHIEFKQLATVTLSYLEQKQQQGR